MLIGVDATRATRAQRTGTENYSLELIHQFARLASATRRVRLYINQPPEHDHWPSSPFVETRHIPFPRLWTHIRLTAELLRQPPDVLFVPAHVLPLICPVPAVVTVHDLGYHYYPTAHSRFSRWYLEWTTRRHARLARHIIADSQATKDDLLKFYQADPAKISVVHLGRDPQLERMTDRHALNAIRQKYGLSTNYLLYLGTLQPRKNLVRLIRAFQQAMTALADQQTQLVIAGKKGWLFDEIFAEATRLDLTEQVVFTDYLPDEEKPVLMSGATAYLFPSLYEGFGLPLLEAMACGTPILTSNTSSLPELAGDATLLVNPEQTDEIANGIITLLTKPDLRETLVERGYQQMQKFDWRVTGERIWAQLGAGRTPTYKLTEVS